jgi:hypothetical protein
VSAVGQGGRASAAGVPKEQKAQMANLYEKIFW